MKVKIKKNKIETKRKTIQDTSVESPPNYTNRWKTYSLHGNVYTIRTGLLNLRAPINKPYTYGALCERPNKTIGTACLKLSSSVKMAQLINNNLIELTG